MNEILNAITELLESGDDTGCDGLICVDAKAFARLQKANHTLTGLMQGQDMSSYLDETNNDT